MANNALFSNKNIKNNVSRNGFDLSKRVLFTAKVGELLPIYHKRVMPGDKFKIDVSSFTRTQPVNTAAYTRIKEYYDFFYVPYRLLWRNAPASLTQMASTANTVALGPNSSLDANQNVPHFDASTLMDFLQSVDNLIEEPVTGSINFNNFFGYNRANLIKKLFSYLGYINYDQNEVSQNIHIYKDVCAFPLLAYQKIYYDFFRNPQWEHNRPECYNVDYLTTDTNLFSVLPGSVVPSLDYFNGKTTMFDLRYCNWQKDMFTGVLPNTQFGSESVVNIDGLTNGFTGTATLRAADFNNSNNITCAGNYVSTRRPNDVTSYPENFTSSSGSLLYALSNAKADQNLTTSLNSDVPINIDSLSSSVQSQLSILALRRATALQKYKEISQLGNTTYRAQIKKHFGVDVPESLGSQCTYIGGFQNAIAINEVVNQNLDTSDSTALIRGKGTSISINNQPIDFDVNEHGLIMCIYHAIPMMDYSLTGQNRDITAVDVSDYAIPEFDRLGMEPADIREYFTFTNNLYNPIFGYLPRYYSYKTDLDSVLGAFNTSLISWVASYRGQNLSEYLSASGGMPLYALFKVNPSILDFIFPVNANASIETDNLLCTVQLSIHAVRNLDFNGLPY